MTDSAGSPGTPDNAAAKKAKSGGGGMNFAAIVAILALVAGGAGFGYGYCQTFVPVEGGALGMFGPGLKHGYFIKCRVGDRSPYNVTVNLNGHSVGSFSTDKIQEVSNYVVKDRNKIKFEAKRLPDGMYDPNHAWITVELYAGKRTSDGGFTDGQSLVKYERTQKDQGDFRDEMDWTTLQ